MRWLRGVGRELVGLFVDDGWLALAIVLWLACVWLALSHLPIGPLWGGVILFLGLAAILLGSVLRRVR